MHFAVELLLLAKNSFRKSGLVSENERDLIGMTHIRLPPAEALGRTLTEFRNLLGADEQASIQIEDSGSYARFRQTGVAALLRDGKISSIFLYADGCDGYNGYRGDLGRLRSDSTKKVVRYIFGQPNVTREDSDLEVLGTPLIYDRYDGTGVSYHFQYDETGKRLQILTIMSAETVQRLGE